MILVVEPVARRVSADLVKRVFPVPSFITKPPLATIFGVGGAAACAAEAKALPASTAPAVSVTVAVTVTRLMRLMPIFN